MSRASNILNLIESSDIKLWRYNNITGYWVFVRSFDMPENAEPYLDLYKKTEPVDQFGHANHFVLAKNKPSKEP